ncbi:MAG: glycerol-3-phosphate dehydrogenase [Alphaproteobacteria bacterium]|nr:glycerol-3-phosphate dehydrogenase [Alphaproteobacteria bacterium]
MADFDILVIGGGVNGAGIARDAAGRGYSVLLCEKDDLAQATSSASSKLIHGGLRYLEQYDFRLVRDALREREVLLRAAPHIVRPLRFVLPHDDTLRPAWLIRAGLFLYDHLGARKVLPGSERIDLNRHPAGAPLTPGLATGFAYSDCRVDDSRLVVLNALDAALRGAVVRPRTAVASMQPQGPEWRATLRSEQNNSEETVTARAVVNAAGPWIGHALDGAAPKSVRLVKGSHFTVPKLYDGDHAYILQNADRRVVFVIPYEGKYSLIGTTDTDYDDDPADVECSDKDIAYLCEAVNRWFQPGINASQITWTYAGVRPLLDDASETASSVSRDYRLDFEQSQDLGPVLTVVGGKVTTYRKLAEQALDRLSPALGGGKGPWTAQAALPGGDMPNADFDAYLAEARRRYSWLPAEMLCRLTSAYGTRLETVLGGATGLTDLGEDFGGGLYEAEVDYLTQQEWATTPDDILWRRSKLGLHTDATVRDRLQAWLD